MSAKLGAVKYGQTDGEPFLGRTMGHESNYSDSGAAAIDEEVRGLIEMAHDEAWEILVEYRDVLDNIVLELMEKETLSKDDLARICARVPKRAPLSPYNGFGKRAPSDKPPVMTPTELEQLQKQAVSEGVNGNGNGTPGVDIYPDTTTQPLPVVPGPGDPLNDPLPPSSDTLPPAEPGSPGFPGPVSRDPGL
jgi:cell division protease FtsH